MAINVQDAYRTPNRLDQKKKKIHLLHKKRLNVQHKGENNMHTVKPLIK